MQPGRRPDRVRPAARSGQRRARRPPRPSASWPSTPSTTTSSATPERWSTS